MIGFTEFRAGIWTKQVNKLITLFLIPNRLSKTKRTYLLIIRSKCSSQRYSTMCSSFPHKSEQILFSVFQLCLDFCGKLLHTVEKHLDTRGYQKVLSLTWKEPEIWIYSALFFNVVPFQLHTLVPSSFPVINTRSVEVNILVP